MASFKGGREGLWRIDRISPVRGDIVEPAPRLAIVEGPRTTQSVGDAWMLRGTTSNTRYTHQDEATKLKAIQPELGRPRATLAALIPIRKNDAWWALAQDQRRAIFQKQSGHIDIGLRHLPAIARRLYHGRDLGEQFDFLTWFEYAPQHRDDFEMLVRQLRATPEWGFVDREVDIRLTRSA